MQKQRKNIPANRPAMITALTVAMMTLGTALLLLHPVGAQAPGAPEWWPCIQRYVPKLSVGRFWEGGLEENNNWHENKEIVDLARRISDRDISTQESLADVRAFMASNGEQQNKVEDLLRATQQTVNEQRDRIIDGINRFAKRQHMMIRRIEQQTKDMENPELTQAQLEDLEARQKWDIRVFEEREGMITYLCEQPVLMAKKFFAVGRAVAEAQNKR